MGSEKLHHFFNSAQFYSFLAEFGKFEGTQLFIKKAPETRQELWKKLGVTPRAIDREVVEIMHRTTMGVDQDHRNIMLQGAVKSGASLVVAIDVQQHKLDIASDLGATRIVNANKVDAVQAVVEITSGEGVDVAIEAVGGTGVGIVQALGMVRHNGILALYGDNYAPVKEFCFHRFHEDGLEIRNLNAVHYTKLRSVENMREAYRAALPGSAHLPRPRRMPSFPPAM